MLDVLISADIGNRSPDLTTNVEMSSSHVRCWQRTCPAVLRILDWRLGSSRQIYTRLDTCEAHEITVAQKGRRHTGPTINGGARRRAEVLEHETILSKV
jgi:hypothetical protein